MSMKERAREMNSCTVPVDYGHTVRVGLYDISLTFNGFGETMREGKVGVQECKFSFFFENVLI